LVPRLAAFGCRFKVLNLALLCENFSDEFSDSTGISFVRGLDARGFDAPLLTAQTTGVQVDVPVMF
jgi:hypothetical protein